MTFLFSFANVKVSPSLPSELSKTMNKFIVFILKINDCNIGNFSNINAYAKDKGFVLMMRRPRHIYLLRTNLFEQKKSYFNCAIFSRAIHVFTQFWSL